MNRDHFLETLCQQLKHPLPEPSSFKDNAIISWHIHSPTEMKIEEAKLLLSEKMQMHWLKSISDDFFQFKADYDFMEDYQTEDWVYKLKFDPHEIYAHMPQPELKAKFIYRLANEEGLGVFFLGLDRFLQGSSQYSPADSWSIQQILNSPMRSKEWKFGCESLEDVMKWIGSDENMQILEKRGIVLWTLEIPENHLVHGLCQLMFRDDQVLSRKACQLNELRKKLISTVSPSLEKKPNQMLPGLTPKMT